MKRLRHTLGRWLLHDAAPPVVKVHVDAEAVIKALQRHKRERGGGSLGLS